MFDANQVEAVLLTGGRSERMGTDKALLKAGGTSLAAWLLSEFEEACVPCTVLGPHEFEGKSGRLDPKPFEGPAVALSSFVPQRPYVFVASCDLIAFRAEIVACLFASLKGRDAALPVVDERAQYLCGLYARRCFALWHQLVAEGARSMRELTQGLDVALVTEDDLRAYGVQPEWCRGANTPDEVARLLKFRATRRAD